MGIPVGSQVATGPRHGRTFAHCDGGAAQAAGPAPSFVVRFPYGRGFALDMGSRRPRRARRMPRVGARQRQLTEYMNGVVACTYGWFFFRKGPASETVCVGRWQRRMSPRSTCRPRLAGRTARTRAIGTCKIPCSLKLIRTISAVFGVIWQIRIRLLASWEYFSQKFEFSCVGVHSHTM